jgi:signal peptidase II
MKAKITGLIFSLILIIADQLSKWAVMEKIIAPALEVERESFNFFEWIINAQQLDFIRIEILPFFNWVMVWNKGVSFGMFQGATPYLMIAVALVITGIFLIWMLRTDNKLIIASASLVIGGALGNVIDRFRFGAVADFLDFHIAGLHWPAFNLADSCITVGIALIIMDGLFFEPKKRDKVQVHEKTD